MTKHSELPWEVHHHSHIHGEQWLSILYGAWDITHNGARDNGVIADSKYSAMPDEENLANAEFIVKAVNMHDELVEAMKKVEAMLESQGLLNHGEPEVYKTIKQLLIQAEAKS